VTWDTDHGQRFAARVASEGLRKQPEARFAVPTGAAVFPAVGGVFTGATWAGGGTPAKPVGEDRAAAEAAASAAGATGAPPTCASIGEPPGRDAAAALADSPCGAGMLHQRRDARTSVAQAQMVPCCLLRTRRWQSAIHYQPKESITLLWGG